MAFDLSTAKPVGGGGFDLSTARPVKLDDLNLRAARQEDLEGQLAVQRAMNPEQGRWIQPVERVGEFLHQAPAELMNEASGFRMGQRFGVTPAEQSAPFQAGVGIVPPEMLSVSPEAVQNVSRLLTPPKLSLSLSDRWHPQFLNDVPVLGQTGIPFLTKGEPITPEHAQTVAGAGTSLGKFISGLTTPENLLTLGGASVAGGASKLLPWIESLFATSPVVSLPGQPSALEEAASRAGEVSVTGTPFEKAEAYTDLGATGAMTPGITTGAMIKGAKPYRSGIEPGEMMSIPTVADISEAPGMNEVNPRVGVVPPERQLAQRLYEPGDVNVGVKPQGGARFVVDPAGRVLPTLQDDMQLRLSGMPVEAFTTDETRQAMRGPKQYQAREERVRPAEDPTQLLLPDQPTIPDDLAARLRSAFEGRTVPLETANEASTGERFSGSVAGGREAQRLGTGAEGEALAPGGKISFDRPAEAGGLPNAGQVATETVSRRAFNKTPAEDTITEATREGGTETKFNREWKRHLEWIGRTKDRYSLEASLKQWQEAPIDERSRTAVKMIESRLEELSKAPEWESAPTPAPLPKDGNVLGSTKEVLSAISKDETSPYNKIAKELLKMGDVAGLAVPMHWFEHKPGIGGQYHPPDFFGTPSPEHITISNIYRNSPHEMHSTAIHEAVHAFVWLKTDPAIRASYKGVWHDKVIKDYLNTGKDAATKELIRAYLEAKQKVSPSERSMYGMTDFSEFVSEGWSNKEFMEVVNKIPSVVGGNVATRVLNAIKRLLGLKPDSTLLNDLLASSSTIVERSRHEQPASFRRPGAEEPKAVGAERGVGREATPEDWEEWKRLKARPVMEEGVWQAREDLKNKYGGNVPLEPKGGDQSASRIRSSERQPLTQGEEPQGREADSGDVLEQASPREAKPVGEGGEKTKGLKPGAHLEEGGAKGEEASVGLHLIDPEEWKKLGFKLGAKVDVAQLSNRLRNVLGKDSFQWDVIKDILPKLGKMSVEELERFVNENGPKVEVSTYGMQGKVSEVRKEYDKMTHEWYDQLSEQEQRDVHHSRRRGVIDEAKHFGMNNWSKEQTDKALRYNELLARILAEEGTGHDTSPSATAAYNTVSAFDTSKSMPDWTTSKEGKNVQRVDVVIPHPDTSAAGNARIVASGVEPGPLWKQDNLHENLPNTLGWAMIQYKTGPKGEKIAVVNEVQSRWGQEKRNQQHDTRPPGGISLDDGIRVADHPLLRDYNRLILKAAIDQARKEGATHIFISDAETAMMTEGHDAHGLHWEVTAPDGTKRSYAEQSYAEQQAKQNGGKVSYSGITQEPGMRLNYDTILPKIMQELTGSKGVRISLGEHKNALDAENAVETGPVIRSFDSREVAGDWAMRQHQNLISILNDKTGQWDVYKSKRAPRENLIFRNPDGTPKTSVSGTMFPIKGAKEDFSTLGKDKATPDRIAEVSPEAKAEFGGSEPGAQAGIDLGPITDVIERYYKQMETAVKSAPLKETFSRLIDGADGAARAYGKRRGNRIRAVLKSRADRDALTFVMEAFDDRAKLQRFAAQVAGTSPHLRRAQDAVQYAIRNYDRLLPHARAALRQMKAQRTLELRNGVATKFYENYIRHVYNNPREVLFDAGQGGNGITTSFKKPRTFATYADAIEAGLRPATLDAANLIESRIASGTKMINRKRWGDTLKAFKDPVSGDPIVVGAGVRSPRGYQTREIVPGVRISVKDPYTGIFDALTGHSGIRNTTLGRVAIGVEGLLKHSLLAADSFHAFRIMQKQLAMTGRVGYNRGLSLLEYDMPTLRYMERTGDISPEIASWVRANKPVGDLLVKEGLNVARIAEAAFADIVRHDIIPNDVLKSFGINAKVPGIGHKDVNVLGQFNKWVFDKVTRGGMMEAAVSEFHRVKAQNPTWSDQKVAAYTAKQVNVFFGNLGRQGIVKSAGGLDVMRLAFLAPQWVESMAQSEIRAAKQIGQVPVDLARGRGARIGSIGRATGIGLLGYVVATQIVNLFTRGHPTWENEEEGHKLDAWIPDPSGNSDGYFVSPLAVFGEMTHDFLRYKGAEDKRGALARIAGNKLSPVFRSAEIARTGRDYAGNKILDTGEHEVMKEAGKALLPVPLPISGAMSDTPGQGWRQGISALGVKVEPANRREAEVGALGKLDLSDRVERQREFDTKEKAPLTRQQRYSIAQHAEENTFQREAKVEKDLDPTVRNFLKENKLQIAGFKPEFTIAGTKVRLTNAEQEAYATVVVEKYNEMISNVMENGGEVTQKRLNTVLEVARRQAMRQFRQTLEK